MTMFHCVSICILWLVLTLVCYGPVEGSSTDQPTCNYPDGSIPCKVWNHTNMDCVKRQLECIPTTPNSGSIRFLNLCFNSLGAIPSKAFIKFHKLLSLDICFNGIPSIHYGSFAGLLELQNLDLSYNGIATLHDNIFSGLSELRNLSCVRNSLSHLSDAAFRGLFELQKLDLASNKLVSLNDNIFLGLRKLEHLNLQSNRLSSLTQLPFQDLMSLQKLNLDENPITFLTNTAFVGLENLQVLNITFDGMANITTSPFTRLVSLRYLHVKVNAYTHSDCEKIEKSFTDLHKLENLHVSSFYSSVLSCPNYNFCSLISLNMLSLAGGANINKSDLCFKTIPLKQLYFTPGGHNISHPPYKLLNHLLNLEYGHNIYSNEDIELLITLDSPLLSLEIDFYLSSLDSATLESCAKWNTSLRTLFLYLGGDDVWIQGSPFKWFTKLKYLQLSGHNSLIVRMLTASTFQNLENLHELHLYKLLINVFETGALNIFGRYNSLKVLDLSYNDLETHFDFDSHLCPIPSLEEVDLSLNNLFGFRFNNTCVLENLTSITFFKQKISVFPPLAIKSLCQQAPHLTNLFAGIIIQINLESCQCLNLAELDLTYNEIYSEVGSQMYVPSLEKLHLKGTKTLSMAVLHIFQAPLLRYLDLSNNFITEINKLDIVKFENLTHLDLSHNQLTSVGSMQNLKFLQTLFLRNNQINIVPKLFLTRENLPSLHTLDLNQNAFLCDCNVEALANWLRTDKVVFLHDYVSFYNFYRCGNPESLFDLSVTQVDLDCEPPIVMYVSVSLTCAIVVTLVFSLVIWYRWHIQYRLFLLFHRRRNFQNNLVDDEIEDEDGPPRYDAYVTYHRQDEDWVGDELEVNIEGGEEPFRLCIKNRDIQAGRLIFNAISQCIQRSRKILVILSPRFVDDNWCHFQLNMAHHRVLEENSSVLIFIILEDIPNNKLTLLLRQLFCKAKCLKWPADEYGRNLFWQRLREELKRSVPLDRRFYD